MVKIFCNFSKIMKKIVLKIKQKLGMRKLSYVILGLFIGLLTTTGFLYVRAAWNDTVSSGSHLTAEMWNGVINNIGWTVKHYCIIANGTCPTGFTPHVQGFRFDGASGSGGADTIGILSGSTGKCCGDEGVCYKADDHNNCNGDDNSEDFMFRIDFCCK